MPLISVVIFIVLLFAIVELITINLVFPHLLPLEVVATIADIFNKTAIGFGALIAGLGSFAYLEGYIEKEKIKMKKRMYQKLYPIKQIGIGENFKFSIIHKKNTGNALYLHDKDKKTMRHIGNYETYVELGWNMIKIEELSGEDYDKITDENEPILISGKIGT